MSASDPSRPEAVINHITRAVEPDEAQKAVLLVEDQTRGGAGPRGQDWCG